MPSPSSPRAAGMTIDKSVQAKTLMCAIPPGSGATKGEAFWPPHLTPMPHQLEAVDFALSRARSYLALDAGLGKTIVAALIANKTGAHIFYVCPPFLVQNTRAEFEKWCPDVRLSVIPDSLVHKKSQLSQIDFQIQCIPEGVEKILIVDEAHRFKNPSSKRARAVYAYLSLSHRFKNDRIIFMSGTPMPNSRPIELYPACKVLAPDIFPMDLYQFGLRYCDAHQTMWGWDLNGRSNFDELKSKIFSSFMLRQKKSRLALPPKTEGLLTVGDGMPAVVSKLEEKILAFYTKEDITEGRIANLQGEAALHLATYLRHLGTYKLKWTLPYLESLLDETDENLLIFAQHKETVEHLSKALEKFKPIVITGDVDKKKRQGLVDLYQKDKSRRVFIGNIQACGVGFTLTKATRVVFVEFSWVDGDNTQAADRAHRIGQDKNVQVQYVVLKDSFDRTRMEVLLGKRANAI